MPTKKRKPKKTNSTTVYQVRIAGKVIKTFPTMTAAKQYVKDLKKKMRGKKRWTGSNQKQKKKRLEKQ